MSNHAWEVEQVGDTIVATPCANLGEIDYDRFRQEANQIVTALDNGTARNVIVDLRKTSYFGSEALGLFVGFWKAARRHNGQFAICSLSEHELEILEIANLHQRWPICTNKEAALEAVKT